MNSNDNVYEYFKTQLGAFPRTPDGTADVELRELPCASNCGRDCCEVIDAAQALIAFTDTAVHAEIMAAVAADISIKWRG